MKIKDFFKKLFKPKIKEEPKTKKDYVEWHEFENAHSEKKSWGGV